MSRKGSSRNARCGMTSKVLSCDTCHSFHLWIRIFLHWELSMVHRGSLCMQMLEAYTRSIFWAHHRSGSNSWVHPVHPAHRAHPVYHFVALTSPLLLFLMESGWYLEVVEVAGVLINSAAILNNSPKIDKPRNPANQTNLFKSISFFHGI